MTIVRILAVALATAAMAAPSAQAMLIDGPVNAPGATAVDSASVRQQDLRHMSAGGDVRMQPVPSPVPAAQTAGDDTPWLPAGIVAATLALVAASLLRRRRATV